jgi:excisionase family DNA binding protein
MSADTRKLAYSIAELAEVAGVGRSFIYEEVKGGRLNLKKAGRRSLVLIADAEAWLAALPDLYTSRSRKGRGEN